MPETPVDFTVHSKTAVGVTLKWRKVVKENQLPVRNFTLWYKSESGAYEVSDVYIRGTVDIFTLSDLSPYTKYYFKMQAVNDIGRLIE